MNVRTGILRGWILNRNTSAADTYLALGMDTVGGEARLAGSFPEGWYEDRNNNDLARNAGRDYEHILTKI